MGEGSDAQSLARSSLLFNQISIPQFLRSHQLQNVHYTRRGSGYFSQSYQFSPSFFHHLLLVFSAARCYSPLILLVHYCITAVFAGVIQGIYSGAAKNQLLN